MKRVNDQAEFLDYLEKGFKPILTEDGSYSLLQKGLSEGMHSDRGAFSESMYVYGQALESFFKRDRNDMKVVISVGLGLGYNEVLAAYYAIKYKHTKNLKIYSYEKETDLKVLFRQRLEEKKNSFFWDYFQEVLETDIELIKSVLLEKLTMFNEFNTAEILKFKKSMKCILFDAYSKNTSPELWSDELLDTLFKSCLEGSFFSTYASTSFIKKALKRNGFVNENKKGFMSKRECTFAHKVKNLR